MNGDVKTKVGFLGLGVMGLPMSENVIRKSGCEVYGYDVVSEKMEAFSKAGGHAAASAEEVYTTCDIIMQMLPTHAIIINSVEQAV
ncbi:NAD(P)-binding domain-containing protein, partial [uncultured Megasphaera sp.]|uniref:NAD(P)-binding domain-containing protein n=1 Tax=uncultured Megasphaera sp. TaxID=165188 RepID=UPI0025CF794E